MLLILTVLYFIEHSTQAAPLSFSARDTIRVTSSSSVTCTCPDQRSIWDILWSCLATIFACSWVSVHPNIPGPRETQRRRTLRRLELMFWSLIAPELIIYWAMRQWIGARKLARLWHGKGWTKTHGYFIQMGGFMLCKGEELQGVLSPERLKELYEEGRVNFPTITEEEIKDRSKADALAKTLVIGQTTWFTLQCLARAIQGLGLTQLELVTVAFAFLNGFMYFLWWNKPLDVQLAVPVSLLDTPKEMPEEVDQVVAIEKVFFALRLWTSFHDALRSVIVSVSATISWTRDLVEEEGYLWIIYVIFLVAPVNGVALLYSRFGDMTQLKRTTTIAEGQMRVATFYASDVVTLEIDQIGNVVLTFATAFGAIHCAGWVLMYPSHVEALIWRISSIIITLIPLTILIGCVLDDLKDRMDHPLLRKSFEILAQGSGFFAVPLLPLYIVARLSLLVEALIGLRALTPQALAIVKWTSFIPHI